MTPFTPSGKKPENKRGGIVYLFTRQAETTHMGSITSTHLIHVITRTTPVAEAP